jgi:hypothetical protein
MADILEFRALDKPRFLRNASSVMHRTAEIVIFPGVRYERHPEPAAAVKRAKRGKPTKPRSRRPRLEAVD